MKDLTPFELTLLRSILWTIGLPLTIFWTIIGWIILVIVAVFIKLFWKRPTVSKYLGQLCEKCNFPLNGFGTCTNPDLDWEKEDPHSVILSLHDQLAIDSRAFGLDAEGGRCTRCKHYFEDSDLALHIEDCNA